jgi:hypothetical protein
LAARAIYFPVIGNPATVWNVDEGGNPASAAWLLGFHALTKLGGFLMARNDLDKVLGHINGDRRSFFRTILVGAAIAAPLMTTQAMAQAAGADPGAGGKCDDGLVVSKKTGKCAVPKKKSM